jgi:hypothetical protein
VFENRVLRRIFGPKWKWREAGEDCIMRSFINLYASSPNIIRVIKQRKMRCVRHVAGMKETRYIYNVLVGKPEDHLKDLRLDGKIILERTLGKYGGMVWTGFIWLRIGASGGHL